MSNPDPDYRLPSRRRVAWEWFGDVHVSNIWLCIVIVFLLSAVVVLCTALWVQATRPPYVLQEDSGFVMYRSTHRDTMTPANVETFLDTVLGKLLSTTPGVYDLTSVTHLVSPRVLEYFTKLYTDTAEARAARDEHALWTRFDQRQYHDANHPDMLVLAVRGQTTVIKTSSAAEGGVSYKSAATTQIYLAYLTVERPTPRNPWGMVLTGFQPVGAEKELAVWNASAPLDYEYRDGKWVDPDEERRQAERAAKEAKRPSFIKR